MTRHSRDTRAEPDPQIKAEFEALVRQHAKPVLAYCMRRSDPSTAHDAAAEVFATAWRRFDSVPNNEAALYWLFGVARRVLANQRRTRRRASDLTARMAFLSQGQLATVDGVADRVSDRDEVHEALRRLKPDDREVLMLIVWEEVPRTEVSRILGISVDAVHKRYQRALSRMEHHLCDGDEPATRARLAERGGSL